MTRFLTGLVAGLAVGYLTAPRSGKDTRQQLMQTAEEQSNRLKKEARSAGRTDQLADVYDRDGA